MRALRSGSFDGSLSRMLPELATVTLFRVLVSFELIVKGCCVALVPVLPAAPNWSAREARHGQRCRSVGTEIIAAYHSRVTDISGEHAGASATVSAPLLPV